MSVKSPITNPRERLKRDPSRVYVPVQKPSDAGPRAFPESPMYDMLENMVSPTNPEEMMYRLESEDVRDTGNSQVALLSCSKADMDHHLKRNAEEANSRLRMPGTTGEPVVRKGVPGAADFRKVEHGNDVIVAE